MKNGKQGRVIPALLLLAAGVAAWRLGPRLS